MMPSFATGLGETLRIEPPNAETYQRSLPVSGLSPHNSPEALITSSCLPLGRSTKIGVDQVPLLPIVAFQTSVPFSLSSAISCCLSALAFTITRFLYTSGLPADPQFIA